MVEPIEIEQRPKVIRADGSVPFTAPQTGVAPVASADLATRGWVLAQPSGGGIYRVPFHTDAGTDLTLTEHPSTEQFLGNSDRSVTLVDLSAFTQVRLIARVVTGSASSNTPELRGRYRTSFSTTVGDYSEISSSGDGSLAVSLASAGLLSSGWFTLAGSAQANDIALAVSQIGGDASANPAVGSVAMEFK